MDGKADLAEGVDIAGGYAAARSQRVRALYGKRIALRAVLDCLDQGCTIEEVRAACAIIERDA